MERITEVPKQSMTYDEEIDGMLRGFEALKLDPRPKQKPSNESTYEFSCPKCGNEVLRESGLCADCI